MRQHQDPDDYEHEDLDRYYEDEDLEELGTPVYQGTGLSVRALTAEELQRFLAAHQGQPAELLGSGWAALDPPEHPPGFPGPRRGLALSPPTRRRWCWPDPSLAAWAAPAAPPLGSIGGAVVRS